MFLIDKPFVSDFLIDTIRNNNFKIIATKVAKELVQDDSLQWIEEEEAIALLKKNPQISIYSNSENALAWIDQNYGESELSNQLKILKNKVKFRELIKGLSSKLFERLSSTPSLISFISFIFKGVIKDSSSI